MAAERARMHQTVPGSRAAKRLHHTVDTASIVFIDRPYCRNRIP
jgi:hypothetical protein